jgi:hypothetical protein
MNCWILDSEIDVHVCNDSRRIQMNRLIESNDELMTKKTIYSIEKYETMNIIVKNSNESINIQLMKVALISEFFTNLMCLRKFIAKEIHWNIKKKKLHHKEKIFCYVKSVENHWVLEKNSSIDQFFETFEIKSEESRSDLMITRRKWHEMLKHLESKTISHLKSAVNEIKIDDLESASSNNQCETCAFIKKHYLMFRQIDQKKSIDHSLNRIEYDLISMIENYNDDNWINHFICFQIDMNFVYTHSRKNDVLSMIREFLKTTQIKYKQIVRFIRMNDEQTLKIQYENFMKIRRSARSDSFRIR